MALSWLLTNLLAGLLLPPANALLPGWLGWLLASRRPRAGRFLMFFALFLLTVQSLPITAQYLLNPLETAYPALPPEGIDSAEAIVILASGRYRNAPEFGGQDDVRQLALERLRYGALLARKSGKPLLVTGGAPDSGEHSEAELMAQALARDFGIQAQWLEKRSANTRENALFSADILLPQGVSRIVLVTHAFHMPRSVPAFEAAGFTVIPAPMAYLGGGRQDVSLLKFIPNYQALRLTGYALHEWIGRLWYCIK